MRKFDKNIFLEESSQNKENNFLFKPSKGKILVVEGVQDVIFYEGFLEKLYEEELYFPKIVYVGTKKDVISSLRENKSSKKTYIVDVDYDQRKKLLDIGAVVTTGYSMENFIFYLDDKNNNLKTFFNSLTELYGLQPNLCNMLYDDFIIEINDYCTYFLRYYAFLKTMSEMNRPWPQSVKEAVYEGNNYDEQIELELNVYSEHEKKKIKEKIIKNEAIIRENNFLYIRGHDLMELLIDFINDRKYMFSKAIDVDDILKLSKYLYIPIDFEKQFTF